MPDQRSTGEGRSRTEAAPEPNREFGFGEVVVRATANNHDLDGLTRPLLEALARLGDFESTYLTVFNWDRREQQVRLVFSAGKARVGEGMTLPLPAGLSPGMIAGVTRSPEGLAETHPDSWVARGLGLKTYASVPVTVARHHLYGMLCAASQEPRHVSENVITVMEFFARIIADHVTRAEAAATEKRAEVAEERLRSRARFLAAAEHMLKTPLVALQGMPEILLEHWAEIPEDQRTKLLEAMVRNARDLGRQIDDLLVEARADVQARELHPTSVELAPLAEMIAKAFAATSPSHEVIADVPEGIVAWADPVPLNQVLGHLLDNAIKYSPGGGRIVLRVVRTPEEVVIDLVDTGVGLPDDVDVFEPFRRGDPGETGVTPGIGLGLHIVRNLVEAMGGSVVARRNADRGSTFTVRLPSAP